MEHKTLYAVVTSIILSVPASAWAAERSLDALMLPEEARLHLRQGRALAAQGNTDKALGEYKKAYERSRSAAVAAEVGLGCLQLKQYVMAAQYLDGALYSHQGARSIRPLDDLDEWLREARGHVVTLHIVTNVQDPDVLVDGQKIRTLGYRLRVFVTPGKKHRIKLQKDGYWTEMIDVQMAAGETRELRLPLQARVWETVSLVPGPRPMFNLGDREAPGWVKPLLITSCVGLGVSLGVGLTGLIAYSVSSAETDKATRHAGVGMMVGGAIGLSLSVLGFGISLASTPAQPSIQIVYPPGDARLMPEAQGNARLSLTLHPVLGEGFVGVGLNGAF